MEESFLHFIWKYQRYNRLDLKTVQGEPLKIIHPGFEHTSAGPDFRMARLTIDSLEWAGPVEIHVRSSDWYNHLHQKDPNYNSVILHVVWIDDRPVRALGRSIPTLELKNLVHRITLDRWRELQADMHWIPCAPFLEELNSRFLWAKHWERLAIERLEKSKSAWNLRLQFNQNHWEETLYQFMARSFGLKENAEPLEQLARATPLRTLKRERGNWDRLYAMMVGQAGWLSTDKRNQFPKDFISHYSALQKKYKLIPIEPHLWRFGGVRPSNFPTVRLEQWVVLYNHQPNMISFLLELDHLSDWFEFASRVLGKGFGRQKSITIALNAIIPFFFFYGQWLGDDSLQEKALNWFQDCPKENNKITRAFRQYHIPISNALESQAAIHQFHQYCRPKKCVLCGIGKKVLNRSE